MRRYLQYLRYVLRHKWFVFQECRKLGVPLWIAIFHDWDKFLPDEFLPYARTFYKPDGTKQYDETMEFSLAWMKHQHRNKHHWQYWLFVDGVPLHTTKVMVWDRGEAQEYRRGETDLGPMTLLFDVDPRRIAVNPMPEVYVREMLADWRGAGKALGFPDTAAWYAKNRDNIILHPDTRARLESMI